MAIDKKRINERADKIENAWEEGDPEAEFKGHKLTDLKSERGALSADEQQYEDLMAQAKLLEPRINDRYIKIDDMLVDVGKGVAGAKEHGDDSPLYGAMGFVRKSERKSGLTRKNKNGDTQ